jgi:hypothetical protein
MSQVLGARAGTGVTISVRGERQMENGLTVTRLRQSDWAGSLFLFLWSCLSAVPPFRIVEERMGFT